MRTDAPMTTEEAQAAANGWTLVNWEAAFSEAVDSAEAEYLRDIDPDNETAMEQARGAVSDALANTWDEGMSHDAWVSAALRRLRHA